MSNTITNLTVELFNALDVVSRELVGLIPAVTSDMTFERAAKGQTVRSPVAPAATASDVAPAVNPPDDGDQTIGNSSMTITKARRVPVRWNGEERMALDNNGAQFNVILRNQFAQAMRALVNEVEADLAALHVYSSRAYGTAGTTPFGTAGDFTDAAAVNKILKDNGADGDRQLVIDTSAGVNLIGKQSRDDIQGQNDMLRRGILLETAGLALRESAQIKTAGTNIITGDVTVTAEEAVGQTVIGVTTAAGAAVSGVTGDIITFAGDDHKYVLAADVAIAGSTTGEIVLQEPGLREVAAAATAISGVAASARNMAFSRSSIALATRAPALPEQGDSAADRMIITDPVSGLSFEVSMYLQYRQVQYEIALAWGVSAVNRKHMAILLG